MMSETAVKEIMSDDLRTVKSTTSFVEVEEIFEANSFHHLPVVDKGEVLLGIISREDLRKAHRISDERKPEDGLSDLKARDIMTPTPLTLDKEDTIGLAADIFLTNTFHALPIIEEGKLVGIVTTHDLLKFAFEKLSNINEDQ